MSKKKSITKVVRKINSNLPVKQKLNGLPLNPIARASGFIIRKKKITTKSLLGGFMLMCHLGKFSFEQWAIQISHLIKETVSRQAVWEKLTVQHRKFIKGVLESVIIKNFERRYNTHISGLWNAFNRVFVQDSTCLKVPDHLWKSFTGGVSKGIVKAVARVQVLLEIKTEQYLNVRLKSFVNNDQGDAAFIVRFLSAGDLVIRDLGYFVTDVFEAIIKTGAYFLSRYHHGVTLWNANGDKINLLALTKGKQFIDSIVYMGKENRLPVRLVGVRLPGQVASERKRKARNDRDRRLNHSKSYMKLLEWIFFVNNVPCEIWTTEQVLKAYKVRWRIEILFKSWKSAFKIEQLIRGATMTKTQIEIILYYILLFAVLFVMHWYHSFMHVCWQRNKSSGISILKFTRFIVDNFQWLTNGFNFALFEQQVIYYCTYDKMLNRKSYYDQFMCS